MSLKEQLSKIKDKEQTTDLYTHLSNVLTKILLDNPKNVYELFEDYSVQVRQSGYDFQKHLEFDNPKRLQTEFDEAVSEKTTKLLNKINIGTVEEPQDAGPCGYVPNMMEEYKWFEWAGVGFGQDETYKIFKSLTLLSVTKQVKQVRLWGKVFGTQQDYYVAEGQAETAVDDGELPFNVEARGTGVNKLNYWVCSDILSGEWIELPLIHPQHIDVARRIRYIFTGNLEAQVITNPFFFGKEKHLLKAQIVRISHSTQIVPKGLYTIPEGEEREIAPTEEYKQPSFEYLRSLENWVHLNPSIQKNGRLTQILPPDLDPEKDAQKEMELLVAADPYEPRLKPINQDTNVGAKAWKFRVLGDQTDYNPLSKNQAEKVNNGVIVIKSLVWPGQVTVCCNKQYQSLYIGHGFKQSEHHFYPKEPQQVQVEAQDREEYPEPNFPADAPVQDNQ